MKSWLLFALAIVSLLSGCDISGLYDYYVPEIIYPSKEDSHEYHLQSGNSFQYFGTEVETIVYEDSAIITGELEYPVIDGVLQLRRGDAVVLVSANCITISCSGMDSLVYIRV